MQMVNAKLGRKHQPISQGPKFSRVQFIPPMIQFKPADRVDREISGFLPLAHTVKELTGKLDTHQVEVGIGRGRGGATWLLGGAMAPPKILKFPSEYVKNLHGPPQKLTSGPPILFSTI